MQYPPNPNQFTSHSPTHYPPNNPQTQSPSYQSYIPAQMYPQYQYAGTPQPYPQPNIPPQYPPSGQYPQSGQFAPGNPGVPYGTQQPAPGQMYGSQTSPTGQPYHNPLSHSAPSSIPPGIQSFNPPLTTVPIPHHHATYPPHHQKIELPPATLALQTELNASPPPHNSGHHSHSPSPSGSAGQTQIPQLYA